MEMVWLSSDGTVGMRDTYSHFPEDKDDRLCNLYLPVRWLIYHGEEGKLLTFLKLNEKG